jgi:hypothetical protein
MVVHLSLMGRMFMLMGAMLAGVVMIMHMRILGVAVLVRMFMDVFVNMSVSVFVGVDRAPVSVLMAVSMGMLMGMQMTVFMFADHKRILPTEKLQVFHKPISLTVMFKLTIVNKPLERIYVESRSLRPLAGAPGACAEVVAP